MTKLLSGFFALSLILGGLYVPLSAKACSCVARYTTTQEDKEAAAAVFYGKVTNIQSTQTDKSVRLEVSKYWKGENMTRNMTIHTAADSAACGYPFEVGKEYVFFAHQDPDRSGYSVVSCSATVEASVATSVLTDLGTGIVIAGGDIISPTPTPVPPTNDPFLTNLSLGMSHPDVLKLQKYLNQNGYVISTTGAGSVGNETNYFGARTKAALIKFQTSRAAELGISIGTGFFGPLTRALLNK
jgi:hypothetical protein